VPANTAPIFALTPNVGVVSVTAANTNSAGTGTIATDIFKAFSAGSNGSWVSRIRLVPTATVAGTATNATIGRVFVSSKTSGATTGGTDTFQLGEVTLAGVTADSASAPTNPIELMLGFALNASWTILVTNHAAPAANTAWQAVVFGGDY